MVTPCVKPTTVLSLCGHFGVPVLLEWPTSGVTLGTPPTMDAELVLLGDQLVVYSRGTGWCEPVLHELCHALTGPGSLDDESELMCLQWALMRLLGRSEYTDCRQAFNEYGVGVIEPGYVAQEDLLSYHHQGRSLSIAEFRGNTFEDAPFWHETLEESKIVTNQGAPHWRRLKVHSDWYDL